MKICPVCNDSFADELNFCDIDGARLAREGSAHEKNKWWSLLGVGLLVGGLVISAASIFFLPKARLSTPVGSSEPQSVPVAPRAPAPAADSASNVAASSEPESAPTDSVVPEVKKRDKALANNNAGGSAPNPKAAALAAEDADKRSQSDSRSAAQAPAINPEPPPAVRSVGATQPAETKPQPPPELKREPKTQPATASVSDKDSSDKKKNDDKNKKKSGGFLRVFKKIFGKD
jgi:hypothetical protein